MIPITWILLGSVLAYLFAQFWRGDKLKKFPGPRLASFTSLWQLWDVYSTNSEPPIVGLHKRYGNVVRVAPNKLFFSENTAVKDIFNVNRDLRKSEFYPVQAPTANGEPVANMFMSTDVKYHDAVRRAFGRGFMPASMHHYEPRVDAAIESFLKQLKLRFADKPGPEGHFDIAKWGHYFALDSISNIAYSKPYGFLERDEDVGNMLRDNTFFLTYTSYVAQAPWLDKVLLKNPLLMWINRKGYLNYVAPPVLFSLDAHQKRKDEISQGKEERNDLLATFLRAKTENPELIDENEVIKMGLAVVFAGADSTAAFMGAIFRYLLKNREVYAKLTAEIDNMPADAKYAELQKYPYLDAVIKESARIFAVIRFSLERVTPPGGMEIAGHYVPGGVVVGVNPWASQRDPAVFGEDVDQFKPERWLDPARNKEMYAKLFLFGLGKYQCLGIHMAYMEIYKVLPAVLRAFHFELLDPSSDWTWGAGEFVKVDNLHVKITSRKV